MDVACFDSSCGCACVRACVCGYVCISVPVEEAPTAELPTAREHESDAPSTEEQVHPLAADQSQSREDTTAAAVSTKRYLQEEHELRNHPIWKSDGFWDFAVMTGLIVTLVLRSCHVCFDPGFRMTPAFKSPFRRTPAFKSPPLPSFPFNIYHYSYISSSVSTTPIYNK